MKNQKFNRTMQKIMFNDKYNLTEAVLSGKKTMTRRIMKDGVPLGNWEETVKHSRFKIGEEVAIAQRYKDVINDMLVMKGYKTDIVTLVYQKHKGWNNKMFVQADDMPHRIRITDIKVERLQDITNEDCLREGIDYIGGYSDSYYFGHGVGNIKLGNSPREAFATLIDKVGKKGTWERNPWCFCYTFELVK